MEALALAVLPLLAFIAFATYAIMRHPFLLLAAPLLVVAYFLFNPDMFRLYRVLVWAPLLIVVCLFAWSVLGGKTELGAVTGAVLVIWYSQRLREKRCANALFAAVREHEDLLCTLWSTRALGVSLKNGDVLWADHKCQDGQITLY